MMKTVLVIDDSRVIRCQVAATLVAGGYQVLQATNGHEGLKTANGLPLPALIICDVNMPEMDGPEFVAAYRQQPGHDQVPIVMLTSEVDPELISQTKRTGASGWMMKPLRADLLLATVRRIVGPPD
jgi:two-component system, chemotaxis family, chemotaxis protein CheY